MKRVIHIMGLGRSGSRAIIDIMYERGLVVGLTGSYPEETKLLSGYDSPMYYINFFSGREKTDALGLFALMTGGRESYDSTMNSDEIEAYLGFVKLNIPRLKNIRVFKSISTAVLLDIINNEFKDRKYSCKADFVSVYTNILNALIDYLCKSKSDPYKSFRFEEVVTDSEKRERLLNELCKSFPGCKMDNLDSNYFNQKEAYKRNGVYQTVLTNLEVIVIRLICSRVFKKLFKKLKK